MSDFTLNKSGVPVIQMRPGAQLDYSFDWTDWLAQVGDDIATYLVDAPAALTKVSVMKDSGIVTVWLAADRAGYQVAVRCDVETTSSPPRKDSRTILIDVRV